MPTPLIPASPAWAEDGTPYSEAYRDIYHSADGGPGQARHVFLAGNGLPERWQGRERFTLLEIGFGLGLNFLTTWAAWRADPRRPDRLHYLAVEKHPFRAADLAAPHASWPEFAELSETLRQAWPTLVPGLHRIELESGRLVLTLALGDVAELLPQLVARPDAIYLDGFAPDRNPAPWSPQVLKRLARLAAPDATLATWTVAGAVRQALTEAGFSPEKRPGFGHKRQMLTARLTPTPYRPASPPPPAPPERRAIVVGAGLAGCAIAERLCRRGWRVTLLEGRPEPAQGASGNLAGIVMPLVSRDDNIASRLTRAAYLHALRAWNTWRQAGHAPRHASCGVLQLARDPRHEALQRRLVEEMGYPPEYVTYLDQTTASTHLGQSAPAGGWWFSQGGWANPPSLCRSMLELARNDGLEARFGARVKTLVRDGDSWRVRCEDGHTCAAPVLILATGAPESGERLAQVDLPIQSVRGQVSLIPAGAILPLPLAVCREGYATPAVDGLHCVGASYGLDDDPRPRQECHEGNLARLDRLLPGASRDLAAGDLAGRVGFRAVPPDRLPLVGALPANPQPGDNITQLHHLARLDGMYGMLGLASRGLIWAPLMAELLACQLEGEPLPLEKSLVDALDPGRFQLRRLRRGHCDDYPSPLGPDAD